MSQHLLPSHFCLTGCFCLEFSPDLRQELSMARSWEAAFFKPNLYAHLPAVSFVELAATKIRDARSQDYASLTFHPTRRANAPPLDILR